VKRLIIAGCAIIVSGLAFAGGPAANKHAVQKSTESAEVVEKTAFITGSLIPQRIQVRRVGTTTVSPIRVIDRQEIDQTGRNTTPGAFVNDPSVRILGH